LEMWEPQPPALAGSFRVLRYDQPGHDGSPLPETRTIEGFARDVIALLDELGLERVSFCGLSLGGAVGMQLALIAPDRLDRLVLCCTSMRFATPEFWEERIAAVRRGGVEAVADVVLERWFTPEFPDVRRYREMLVSTPAEGYARCCEALGAWDTRGKLGAVRAPALAIAAADDPSTPPAELEAIAGEIDRASLVVIDRARHLANVERAAEFNDALLAHLAA
ncbi:MAG: alpha/beta fold hydrolase, partial [Actinomycetota bacterium]|nr:alpha/beta fold hydrolase [Actinomycetota bacterium]